MAGTCAQGDLRVCPGMCMSVGACVHVHVFVCPPLFGPLRVPGVHVWFGSVQKQTLRQKLGC